MLCVVTAARIVCTHFQKSQYVSEERDFLTKMWEIIRMVNKLTALQRSKRIRN